MSETLERVASRLAELEREVARLRAVEYAGVAGTLSNDNATIDADGNATVASLNVGTTGATAGQVRASGTLLLSGQTSAAQGAKALSLADEASAAANGVGTVGRGLYVIYSQEDGATCVALRNFNTTVILSDTLDVFRASDTDGYSCLLSASGQPFTIKNRRGSTRTYWVHHLGFPTA